MAALLPIFTTDNKDLTLLQTNWAKSINPLLKNPSLQSNILSQVDLAIGSNTINHLLGRKLQGWRIVRLRANAAIYDNQDNNPRPDQTLILVSDAVVSCDIEVF